ncbi:MAG: class I SAM-dependent methyltransferase [Saprospiraceae bacterium]
MKLNSKELRDQKDWDEYWGSKSIKTKKIYDFIASAYRDFFLRKYVSYFSKKNFNLQCTLLHAGCGGGQVDSFILNDYKVTALDISEQALNQYKLNNGNRATTILGSIFQTEFENEMFDGIYNLGVMEHFTPEEIQNILVEFKRILKPTGKIVIYWPPVFGLSVKVLDFAHFLLHKVFRQRVQLHPPEITRIKSKNHAISIFSEAGFKNIQYYFGPKDLFVQCVISASIN